MMMNVQEKSDAPPLSIAETAERYGMTADQLRYLDELGVLVPSRLGGYRAYTREDLEKLAYIIELRNQGVRPSMIRLMLQLDRLLETPSVSGTRLLKKMISEAPQGEVIRRPLADESSRAYNSTYRALQRAALAAGRRVQIGKSEDGRTMEARIIE
jgi:DNA-binding transcriptional MerR regulator